MNLEEKIKLLLAKNKISIETLAGKIDISKGTLLNIFKRNEANTKHLEKIANYFNVDLVYFFDKKENSPVQNGSKIVGNNNNLIHNESDMKEIDYLKRENELLREMIVFLKSKLPPETKKNS